MFILFIFKVFDCLCRTESVVEIACLKREIEKLNMDLVKQLEQKKNSSPSTRKLSLSLKSKMLIGFIEHRRTKIR